MTHALTVVTWNVNSLRVRLPHVLRFLDERTPDVLCLQETKLAADKVVNDAFVSRGYHVHAVGTGGYAGVATLSKEPLHDVVRGFSEVSDDVGRRLLGRMGDMWIDNVYVPTRRAIGKAEFLDRLTADYALRFDARRDELVLCGDFNICFDARDLASPTMISEPALLGRRPEDLAFRRTLGFGLHDCLRKHHADAATYSWFPLTPWALRRNYGMRLDYVFATQALYRRCESVEHDQSPRGWPRPSDHVPVLARFAGDVIQEEPGEHGRS
jgi:exodeoxyribonuclease-3